MLLLLVLLISRDSMLCRCDADFSSYALLTVCFNCITNGLLLGFVLLLLSFLSGINHRFVSVSLGFSMIILLSLYACIMPFLKTMVQFASHSTGTDITVRSILSNPCPFCASTCSSGDSCSCQVVTESIVFELATPTLVSSCGSSFPGCLCLLDRNMLIAAESGCPCGMFLLFNISLNLEVRFDRRVTLSLYISVTAAAYDIWLLLLEDGV